MADIAKPRNREEEAKVNVGLRKKYPHMSEKSWTDRLKKATRAELKKRKTVSAVTKIKQAGAGRDASLREALSPAEYKRLTGG